MYNSSKIWYPYFLNYFLQLKIMTVYKVIRFWLIKKLLAFYPLLIIVELLMSVHEKSNEKMFQARATGQFCCTLATPVNCTPVRSSAEDWDIAFLIAKTWAIGTIAYASLAVLKIMSTCSLILSKYPWVQSSCYTQRKIDKRKKNIFGAARKQLFRTF